LKKNLNDNQGRRWLSHDHHWKTALGFDGLAETRAPPIPVTGEDIVRWGRLREAWQEDSETPLTSNPARRYGIKRSPVCISFPTEW
jgi:hypothetical protein